MAKTPRSRYYHHHHHHAGYLLLLGPFLLANSFQVGRFFPATTILDGVANSRTGARRSHCCNSSSRLCWRFWTTAGTQKFSLFSTTNGDYDYYYEDEDNEYYDDDEEEDQDNVNSGNNNIVMDDFSRDDDFQRRSKQWILIVDDEESIRKSVGQLLFDSGFRVTACADGETALRIIAKEQQKLRLLHEEEENQSPSSWSWSTEATSNSNNNGLPNVIVSDIRMPGRQMDGIEFLQILRQNELLQSIPVVLLTAKATTQDRIVGYNAGADAYLPKPLDPDELIAICDNLIRQYDILNGHTISIDDLKKDLHEIKFLLLQEGGAGVGNGWVQKTTTTRKGDAMDDDDDNNNNNNNTVDIDDLDNNDGGAVVVFLAPDEREVLEFLCEGLMNKEIASKTFLSTRRVEQLLTSMYRKVGVKNRTELVRWAVSSGNVQI